jgi:hypothetical protein
MSSERESGGIRLSDEGAMMTVEKVASHSLPDVFADSDPDDLRRMAERLERRVEELAEEPMRNRNRIEDLSFKMILLSSMADDDSSFRGGRLDDEDGAEDDEADVADEETDRGDRGGDKSDGLDDLEDAIDEAENEPQGDEQAEGQQNEGNNEADEAEAEE